MNPVPPVTNAFMSTSGPLPGRILVRGTFPHNAGVANPGDVLENPIFNSRYRRNAVVVAPEGESYSAVSIQDVL